MSKKEKSFEELLDEQYGAPGTATRDAFEQQARWFTISEMIREARKSENLTLEQLGKKIGTSKTYLSKVENGKSDMMLSTLYRIIEDGCGKKLVIYIE